MGIIIKKRKFEREREPVTYVRKGPVSTEQFPSLTGHRDSEICLGEELLTSHLQLTAPEKDGIFLPIEGHELRDGSEELFRGLNPENTAQAMLATMAVGIFNASLSAVSDGSRQNAPERVRDINMRHGIRGATVTCQLLQTLQRMQNGPGMRVSVGAVNVAAGGQAIVGNVAAGKEAAEEKPKPLRSDASLG